MNNNYDLFEVNSDQVNEEYVAFQQKKLVTMSKVRSDWYIGLNTSTGRLFKFQKIKPKIHKGYRTSKLFVCKNESIADLLLNSIKGAAVRGEFIIPKYDHDVYSISIWMNLVTRNNLSLSHGGEFSPLMELLVKPNAKPKLVKITVE